MSSFQELDVPDYSALNECYHTARCPGSRGLSEVHAPRACLVNTLLASHKSHCVELRIQARRAQRLVPLLRQGKLLSEERDIGHTKGAGCFPFFRHPRQMPGEPELSHESMLEVMVLCQGSLTSVPKLGALLAGSCRVYSMRGQLPLRFSSCNMQLLASVSSASTLRFHGQDGDYCA